MTPERFHQIVEAYGADPRRWPQQERAAAEAWAAAHRAEADALLADAAGIDAWLAADKVDPPHAALQQRIIGSAPGRRPDAPRRKLWWSGAAVAGVGVLGGVAGAFAVSFFVLTGTVPPVHESSYLTSSFGGSSADWSGE
ncbi:hypothetical protein R75461_06962 [Paraburkholderia nemoris]|uniref:hypothetical protein n=1 Tax=Paraburkholderia nemoris TaxID=2793076 RepID=UPI0006B6337D|nr:MULTISPECIES: hypothetical protein [Paraburkholderia]KPD16952.1 hypothetical protein ADM96_22100 [Burkholderia sp. ST111]MBK3741101.1 hypothetical protein [Paraburkholderia aspalathi]MBK3785610.1 hypothetical protein [Paraburkholderia aspalathi]CAE6744979.1 hypothetical protein R69619_02652 [Paraburkholderia nemoris]CAE6826815.1 hypothetical protein LMG22931_06609 [Paraburkholderia nemoris]